MAQTTTLPAGQLFRTIGTCGKCGGPVSHTLDEDRSRARCRDCGARVRGSHGPLLPMEEGGTAYLAAPVRQRSSDLGSGQMPGAGGAAGSGETGDVPSSGGGPAAPQIATGTAPLDFDFVPTIRDKVCRFKACDIVRRIGTTDEFVVQGYNRGLVACLMPNTTDPTVVYVDQDFLAFVRELGENPKDAK